jgi:L-arabinokinase
MDQLASSLGAPGCVLPILCRPDAVEAPVALPPGVVVVGWPSGVEHSLADTVSPYLVARTASFMAKKILEGLDVRGGGGGSSAASGVGKVDHLSQFSPSQLASVLEELPELLSGADFTRVYGGVDDPLSVIEPEALYRVRAGALFPVSENFR